MGLIFKENLTFKNCKDWKGSKDTKDTKDGSDWKSDWKKVGLLKIPEFDCGLCTAMSC